MKEQEAMVFGLGKKDIWACKQRRIGVSLRDCQ